jgi:uncharacterized protein YbjT (DUF2867 family)
MPSKTVLVFGAGGGQGSAVVNQLNKVGHRVRAIVRSEATASRLNYSDQVEVVFADLDEPSSLAAANDGVDEVVLILPLQFDPDRMRQQGLAAIQAAVEAGVGQVTYNTSIAVDDQPIGYDFFDRGMLEVVRAGQSSGLSFVTLRPPLYLDNLLAPWTLDGMLKDGELRYAVPAGLALPWSSFQSQAEFVAATIGRSDLDGRVLDIAWPERFTVEAVAEAIAHALDRSITFVATTPKEMARSVVPHWGDAGGDFNVGDDRGGHALVDVDRSDGNDDGSAHGGSSLAQENADEGFSTGRVGDDFAEKCGAIGHVGDDAVGRGVNLLAGGKGLIVGRVFREIEHTFDGDRTEHIRFEVTFGDANEVALDDDAANGHVDVGGEVNLFAVVNELSLHGESVGELGDGESGSEDHSPATFTAARWSWLFTPKSM